MRRLISPAFLSRVLCHISVCVSHGHGAVSQWRRGRIGVYASAYTRRWIVGSEILEKMTM
eukprot:scaffold232801_cov43-Tisochrysis_lutea.AAC.2